MAVSEETLDQRRSIHVPRPGVKFVAFLGSAVLGVALVVGGLVAFHETLAGRIMPGVSIAGVDVGGMTPDDARTTLAARNRSLAEGALVVRAGMGSTSIPFADVGRAADVDGLVTDAYARGRGGSWLDETIAGIRLRIEPQAVQLRLLYDPARAASAVTAYADRVVINPVDASIVRTGTGFAVNPSIDGRRIDVAATVAAVDQAMSDAATPAGSQIDASVARIDPIVSTESAERARAAAALMAANLRLTNEKSKWDILAAQINSWISFVSTGDGYRPVIDRQAIGKVLAPIAKKVAKPVFDAAFLRDKRGRIVGAQGDHAGRALDLDATANGIVAALEARANGDKPAIVKLSLVAVLPKRTTKDVTQTAPLMVKVGSWTTHYQVAAHNGFAANITVPARTLNGTVVQPGQLFDFWGALGEVSFRTGYRLGGAIVGGHSVEGKALAGGICAASTTLFNAALRGGFEIVSRSPHWYYIKRYPLGLDATVSGSQSMRFRNDTQYPILIRGIASPGVVRFEIWSVPNGRTVSLSRPSVTNVVAGYDSTVKTSALPAGTRERIEWPVDGKDVVVTRTVRDASGRVIHRETYVSHYHRMVGITRIGIG